MGWPKYSSLKSARPDGLAAHRRQNPCEAGEHNWPGGPELLIDLASRKIITL